MTDDLRRAKAAFGLYDAGGSAVQQGEAVAVVGDGALSVGPLVVSFLDGDPCQVPLGALTAVQAQDDPPGVVLKTEAGSTVVGQLARHQDAFRLAVMDRLEEQARLLTHLTGQEGFADGLGISRARIDGFGRLLERFTAPERTACAEPLLAAASDEPRLGFVELLDPDAESLQCPEALPENWASFLLVPVGALTVLEILARPSAATYVFRGGPPPSFKVMFPQR